MSDEATEQRDKLAALLADRYTLVREIGQGGMGTVHLARDRHLHRMLAIKVLRREVASSAEWRERFVNEARLTGHLAHSGIVPVYDVLLHDDIAAFIMPFCPDSLATRQRERGRFTAYETTRVLAALAETLTYVHRQGVLHRDIKPENVFIAREGSLERIILGDFGIATMPMRDRGVAGRDQVAWSPSFASPEQILGKLDLDRRSDIYSLGVLGYEMLTGANPFEGQSLTERLTAQQAGRFVPIRKRHPLLDRALVVAIERCLAPDPSDRWRNADEFRTALLGGSLWARAWRSLRRRRPPVAKRGPE